MLITSMLEIIFPNANLNLIHLSDVLICDSSRDTIVRQECMLTKSAVYFNQGKWSLLYLCFVFPNLTTTLHMHTHFGVKINSL